MLLAALERNRPAAARALAAAPESFVLVDWTHLFYERQRDISARPAGHRAPDRARRADGRGTPRSSGRGRGARSVTCTAIGDAVPLLGRWVAQPALRAQMHEANRYLRNRDGIGAAIRAPVRAALDRHGTEGRACS